MALLTVPYLATLNWSLLTPRQPLSALPPYLLALSHTSGTWHPLLIFLYSTEAKNKKKQKAGWLATVCQTGSSAERQGLLVQCFSASPGMGKGRWNPSPRQASPPEPSEALSMG